MAFCLIALGSNLGDRQATLQAAVRRIELDVGQVHATSPWHATRSIGGPSGQPEFLNGAIICESAQAPPALLQALQRIEASLGRTRNQRWDARPIDLDLLLYEQVTSETPELTLPHPRMAFRRFVLEPAVEVAPDWIHPPTQFSLSELLSRLDSKPIHVSIVGEGCQRIARDVAAAKAATLLASKSQQPASSMIDSLSDAKRVWEFAVLNPQQPVVSDFWIGQFPMLAGQSQISVRDELQRMVDDLPTGLRLPHLVVCLGDIPEGDPLQFEKVELLRALRRPRQFPVLMLHGVSDSEVVAESIAAISAME